MDATKNLAEHREGQALMMTIIGEGDASDGSWYSPRFVQSLLDSSIASNPGGVGMLVKDRAVFIPAAADAPKPVALTDEQIEPLFRIREHMPTTGERDAWYWYAWGAEDWHRATLAAPQPAPVEAQAVPEETMQVVGIKDGKETVLGTATITPRMKARDLVREMFGGWEEDDGSEADLAFAVCESLLRWMGETPRVFTAAAPAPSKGEAHE